MVAAGVGLLCVAPIKKKIPRDIEAALEESASEEESKNESPEKGVSEETSQGWTV